MRSAAGCFDESIPEIGCDPILRLTRNPRQKFLRQSKGGDDYSIESSANRIANPPSRHAAQPKIGQSRSGGSRGNCCKSGYAVKIEARKQVSGRGELEGGGF